MERHFPILKDKIDRKNPNIPETAHCYQTKNETNKNNFFFVSSKILPENKLQGSQFFLLWKLKRGKKESKSFHLCVKSSCYTKGHWFYTPVLDQMLSLFFKWSCFYGWCNAVDIYWGLMQVLYLDWHLSWVTTLTYFMTWAPRSWKTMCSKLHMPGHLPVLLTSSVPAISKGSWIFWASSFLFIKRRKLMEWSDDFFLHWNTFMIRYETLRCHGRRSELEIRA